MCRHAIVVVTYNRLEKLRLCLQCIEKQTLKYDTLIVVDNASTDGTAAFLEEKKKHSGCLILTEKTNLGGAGGFAEGLKEAFEIGAEWITIIDDDAMLGENFLGTIERAIESDEGKYLSYAGVPETRGLRIGHRRRVTGRIIKKEKPVPAGEYEEDSFICQIGSFCGLVIHRRIIEEHGLPDASFFLWYDDTEYCLRFSEKYPIKNVNGARIDHQAENYRSDVISWKEYYNIRNRIVMSRRHYGFLTSLYLTLRKIGKCGRDSASLCFHGRRKEALKLIGIYRNGINDGWSDRMGLHGIYRPGFK